MSQEEYEDDIASAEEDMKSPKIPEYSHLPPDPIQGKKSFNGNFSQFSLSFLLFAYCLYKINMLHEFYPHRRFPLLSLALNPSKLYKREARGKGKLYLDTRLVFAYLGVII